MTQAAPRRIFVVPPRTTRVSVPQQPDVKQVVADLEHESRVAGEIAAEKSRFRLIKQRLAEAKALAEIQWPHDPKYATEYLIGLLHGWGDDK